MDDATIAGQLSELDQRSKSNSHRLDRLEEETQVIHSLATSVAVMAQKLEHTSTQVDKLCNDVGEMKEEPANRWRFVVEKCLYFIIGGIMGFILIKIGLQ